MKPISIYLVLLLVVSCSSNTDSQGETVLGYEQNITYNFKWNFSNISQLVYLSKMEETTVYLSGTNDTLAVEEIISSGELHINILGLYQAEIGTDETKGFMSTIKFPSKKKSHRSLSNNYSYYEVMDPYGDSGNEYALDPTYFLFASLPTNISSVGENELLKFYVPKFNSIGTVLYSLDSINNEGLAFISGTIKTEMDGSPYNPDGYIFTSEGRIEKIFNIKEGIVESAKISRSSHLDWTDGAGKTHANNFIKSEIEFNFIEKRKFDGKSKLKKSDIVLIKEQ